jgi:eukaryotic-like serine/threonine-protein kinase
MHQMRNLCNRDPNLPQRQHRYLNRSNMNPRKLVICPKCQCSSLAADSDGICPACFVSELAEDDAVDPVYNPPGLRIREEIARGGVGIVYRAEQIEPQRDVAVKILQPQWAKNERVRRRFRREAHAMARLEHPAILPVHEVGETDDALPWFTMKLATGGSLAQHIGTYRGQWRRIAELTKTLAEALDFAHQHGVLHRDIKPGNVLFDGEGRPYLCDFGVAKQIATLDPSHTLPSDLLGTPQYLPPEVATGGAKDATIAGDVYGLGAVLYELLAGHPPFRAASVLVLLRNVANVQPPPLMAADPRPPIDLASVCAKAMEREPKRRYATAGEMAEDLRRYLNDRPTIARPIGWFERAWRWSRRHPVGAALASIVIVLLMMLGIGSVVAAWRIRRAQNAAQLHLRESLIAQASSVRIARPPGFRDQALYLTRQAAAVNETDEFRVRRRSEVLSALAYPTLSKLELPSAPIHGMEFATASPGWEFIAWQDARKSGSSARPAVHWRITRGSDGAVVSTGHGAGIPYQLSADGKWLATQSGDEAWQLWRIDKSEAAMVRAGIGVIQDFSVDGNLLAFHFSDQAGHRFAQVREISEDRVAMTLQYPDVALTMKFDPSGEYCAVAPSFYMTGQSAPYSVRILRSRGGALVREVASALGNCVWCMAWSADGRSLLAAERGGPVYIWDTVSGNTRHILRGPGTQFWRAAFSPDGQKLAAAGEENLCSVFDLASGRPIVQCAARFADTFSFQWTSPESFGPVVSEGKMTLLRFQSGAFTAYQAPDAHGGVLGIAASPDGRWTALGDSRHAWLWDHERQQPLPPFAAGLWNSFRFSHDGRWLYGCGEPGVRRWQIEKSGTAAMLVLEPSGFHNSVALNKTSDLLSFDHDKGHRVCVVSQPDSEHPPRRELDSSLGLWTDISSDGRLLVSAGHGTLKVWSIPDSRLLHSDKRTAKAVCFSPDSRWLFKASEGYEIWSTKTWRRARVLDAPDFSNLLAQAIFHPTRPLLVGGCSLGRICVWSTDDWRLLGILENPNQLPVQRLSFDASGDKLHLGSAAGVFATWDFQKLSDGLSAQGLDW